MSFNLFLNIYKPKYFKNFRLERMTNEVTRVAYTPTASVSTEQSDRIKRDGNATSPVVFDGNNNQSSEVNFSGKINLSKETREKLIRHIEEKIKNLESHFNNRNIDEEIKEKSIRFGQAVRQLGYKVLWDPRYETMI